MTILDVIKSPNPILKQRCDDVVSFDDKLHELVDDLFETMRHNKGIGLAAPQVGVLLRLFVCELEISTVGVKKLVCINPKLSLKGDLLESEEGCLSIPNKLATVDRFSRVSLDAFDKNGNVFSCEATDLLAIVLQHENDHLNGKLITDNPLKLSSTIEVKNE